MQLSFFYVFQEILHFRDLHDLKVGQIIFHQQILTCITKNFNAEFYHQQRKNEFLNNRSNIFPQNEMTDLLQAQLS